MAYEPSMIGPPFEQQQKANLAVKCAASLTINVRGSEVAHLLRDLDVPLQRHLLLDQALQQGAAAAPRSR